MFFANWITLGTSLPEAAMKLVHRKGFMMEAIDVERGTEYVTLALIAHLSNVIASGGMGITREGTNHETVGLKVFGGETVQALAVKLVIAPVEPFEGLFGLVDSIWRSSSGFTGSAV